MAHTVERANFTTEKFREFTELGVLHSYWLELNYCIQIKNHLFTLHSQEPFVL